MLTVCLFYDRKSKCAKGMQFLYPTFRYCGLYCIRESIL